MPERRAELVLAVAALAGRLAERDVGRLAAVVHAPGGAAEIGELLRLWARFERGTRREILARMRAELGPEVT